MPDAARPPETRPTDAARPVAIIDVDGVVADVRHRLHLLRQPTPAWDEFFAAADADPPLPEGIAIVRTLMADHEIVWLTGRPERTRAVTACWLDGHGLPTDTLVMRPDRDHRASRAFKGDEVKRIAADRTVAVVVDDDPSVVSHLRANGWPVVLADWLPYELVLRKAQEEGRT